MDALTERWARVLAVLLTLTLVLPLAMTHVSAQGAPKVLRVQHPTYPDIFDPQKSSYSNELDILALDYEGLTRLDDKQTVPAAAESWEFNKDPTQITFHLRPNLKYSDGSPLTAEDFAYAAERTCDPKSPASYQSILFGHRRGCEPICRADAAGEGTPARYDPRAVQEGESALGVQALDDKTLQVRPDRPRSLFPDDRQHLGLLSGQERPRSKDPAPAGGKTATNQSATGPSRSPASQDQEVAFAANANYWRGGRSSTASNTSTSTTPQSRLKPMKGPSRHR